MDDGGDFRSLGKSPYDIAIFEKYNWVTKDGIRTKAHFWAASWEKPRHLQTRPRDAIVATSRRSEDEARERAIAKVLDFVKTVQGGAYALPAARPRVTKVEIPEKPDRTVQSFIEEWFNANVESNRWQLSTLNGIQQKFEDYVYPYLGEIKLDALTHEQVRRHFTLFLPSLKKLDRDGNSTNARLLRSPTIRNILLNFHMAIVAARAKNWIAGDPAHKIIIPSDKTSHNTDDNIFELVDALVQTFINEPDMDDQGTIRVAIAFFCGLRRGERCGLRWADIQDLDGSHPQIIVAKQLGYISENKGGVGHFITDTTKTGRPRKFPIPALLVPYLQHQKKVVDAWKADEATWNPMPEYADLILTTPTGSLIKLNDDSEIINKWFADYSIDVPEVTAGDIRHASATWWVGENGLERDELKKMFGWTKDSEMDRYYARLNLQPLAKKARNATLKPRNNDGN
jgi:integrase